MRVAFATLIRCAALTALLPLGACDTAKSLWPASNEAHIAGDRIPVMASSGTLEADPRIADLDVVLPKPYVNDSWPQPGGFPDNALYHLAAPGPLERIWSADAGSGSSSDARLTAPPIVAEGKVFVLDANANVRAFDAANGDRLWDVDLTPEDEDSDEGFGGGVAYDTGRIFVSSGFGFVVALDANSGKEIWRRTSQVPFRAAPTVNGGRVFVANQENQLLVLATDDGRLLWDHRGIGETPGMISATSAAVAGELVVVPYTSGEVFALRVVNGRVAWSDSLTSTGQRTAMAGLEDISGRPVIDRDLVFVVGHGGRMVAIDQRTGGRVWTRDISGVQTPWVAGDFVYVVSTNGELICLTRKEGRIRWLTRLPAYEDEDDKTGPISWAGPVLVSDRLLVVSSKGDMLSVSPYKGDILGKIDIPNGVYIAPVVANGIVYVLTDDAGLIALK